MRLLLVEDDVSIQQLLKRERFVKGEQSPGHGFGLAFVDAVAQAHGGAARISDRSGGGAVVALFLPLRVLQAV
jgi:signal transduction histidine kinase